ncbi:ral GTPase-activating protein subunit beta-like [Acanthochromis polyacanthus]|uniref:ral GTPase-activating protein subunit beta-like n=1 Tax=Acanthochromis polyacanthus TaxID=80966 RepID=UPI0022344B76|nr:ral GTPase-activating protein subunit beta-like [Acanthochromis polyacanthus]
MLNVVQDSALFEVAGQTQQEPESQHSGAKPRRTAGGTSGNRWTRGPAVQSDAAAVLWVQFVRSLTQRLTSQWRNDSAVCLSALEVLGGLAKVQVQVDEVERRRAVSSVCTYIVFQCSRPPQLHSRDLHSIIVAAFYCLNVWLTQHPALLDHQVTDRQVADRQVTYHQVRCGACVCFQECLLEVLEIVELGISGSKSRQEQEVKRKEEKDLNPASLRVKEAAEATLSCIMQVSEAFPFVGGSLSEDALIGCSALSDSSLKKFRYFVVESSVILAMLEQGSGPEQAPYPSLTVLIRGPSGRHIWTLELHLQPRGGRAQTQQSPISEQSRGTQEDAGIRSPVKHQLFPENMDRVPPVRADRSIPALQETATEQVQQQLECLRAALRRQQQIEARPIVSGRSVVMTTCRPPPLATRFQTARLFLSHLGLLTPDSVKDPGISGVPAHLVSLDSSLPGFSESLRRLDKLPPRNCDSAFIFYLRAGQRTAAEVLRNVESRCSVQSHFLDLLSSLGWPVQVGQQQGGGAHSSRSEFRAVLGDSGGDVFDGRTFVLMFSDALTDITFIVPSPSHKAFDWSKTSEEAEPLNESPSDLQNHPDSAPNSTTCPVVDIKLGSPVLGSGCQLMIVWVERFEDIESFPLKELMSEHRTQTRTQTESSPSDVQLVFIHPLKTGLYSVCLHGNGSSKFSLAVPLVSGSVVSMRSLGFLLREMVINGCHRRRLDSDSAPPPHIRRKHAISDIIHRYRCRRSEPAFYSALFQDL